MSKREQKSDVSKKALKIFVRVAFVIFCLILARFLEKGIGHAFLRKEFLLKKSAVREETEDSQGLRISLLGGSIAASGSFSKYLRSELQAALPNRNVYVHYFGGGHVSFLAMKYATAHTLKLTNPHYVLYMFDDVLFSGAEIVNESEKMLESICLRSGKCLSDVFYSNQILPPRMLEYGQGILSQKKVSNLLFSYFAHNSLRLGPILLNLPLDPEEIPALTALGGFVEEWLVENLENNLNHVGFHHLYERMAALASLVEYKKSSPNVHYYNSKKLSKTKTAGRIVSFLLDGVKQIESGGCSSFVDDKDGVFTKTDRRWLCRAWLGGGRVSRMSPLDYFAGYDFSTANLLLYASNDFAPADSDASALKKNVNNHIKKISVAMKWDHSTFTDLRMSGDAMVDEFRKIMKLFEGKTAQPVIVSYPNANGGAELEIAKILRLNAIGSAGLLSERISREGYSKYFIDRVYDEGGHMTEQTGRIFASHVARKFLQMHPKLRAEGKALAVDEVSR